MHANLISRRRLLQTLAFSPLWDNAILYANPPSKKATLADVDSIGGVPTLVVGGAPTPVRIQAR